METLHQQFMDALSNLQIDSAPAIAAHLEVRTELETDRKLIEWAVNTTLIGSYKRGVAIYPCHDVDVFVKLEECPETDPEVVFTEVQRALREHFGTRAKEQRRSMTVEGFEGGLSVDAVPAIPDGRRWRIPQTDHDRKKNQWEPTDPETMTDLSAHRNNSSQQITGQHAYVPMVKLVRQARRAHLGKRRPHGFYFELLTYQAFAMPVPGNSFAEIFTVSLDRVATQLESRMTVLNPALNAPFDPAPDPGDLAFAAEKFRALSNEASIALESDRCSAAVIWRTILGEVEDRGYCFPIPPGCTESGTPIAQIRPNRDLGPDRERPFA